MFKCNHLWLAAAVCLWGPLTPAEAARWAVLIGPDRYDRVETFRPLRYAGQDVRHLANTLTKTGYQPEHLVVMTTDAEDVAHRPTRTAILRQLQKIIGQIGLSPADSLMVVFAGHGVSLQGRSYLCPADARLDRPAETLISLSELSNLLASLPAGQKFLVIDACREEIESPSDAEFNLLTGLRSMKVDGEGPQGLIYFASCLARQRSIEDEELKHGVFLYYFAEALSGLADVQSAGNRDGEVSWHEAFQYASDKTRQRSRAQTGWEQQPWYEGRATSGLTLATLSEEQRLSLKDLDAAQPEVLSGEALHSQLELTEALLALQSGDLSTVIARSMSAIQLDPSNRMAYRTASIAYQVQGMYAEALSNVTAIDEPLSIRLADGSVSVMAVRDVVGVAEAGDILEIRGIQRSDQGTEWASVKGIRRKGSRSSTDFVSVDGYVRLDDLRSRSIASDQVREFGRRTQQPTYVAQSWEGQGRAAAALERWDRTQAIMNHIPYAPSIPSIPYGGTIRSLIGR